MKKSPGGFKSIDDYVATFPDDIKEILEKIRTVIKKAAPDAREKISYHIPTFAQEGNLVHFAAFKGHIGFYPTPSGVEAFKEQLSGYEYSKGAIRFPIDRPIPYELIRKMVLFRVRENLAKSDIRMKRR